MTALDYTSNPTAADADELTVLLTEERHARTLGRIARRAENLWADGYTATSRGKSEHFLWVSVASPAGEFYLVCLSDTPADDVFGDSCSCPAFAKHGECKHHLAVLWRAHEEAQAAAFEGMIANGEAATGCDPYSEF